MTEEAGTAATKAGGGGDDGQIHADPAVTVAEEKATTAASAAT